MRSVKSCIMAGVALGCFGIAGGANAQVVFGGGSTFAAPTYRLLMDCWGVQVDGAGADHSIDSGIAVPPISSSCGSPTGDASGITSQFLYAPVGSGGGKRALTNHDGSSSTSTGLGVPGGSNTIPFTSSLTQGYGLAVDTSQYGYPSVQWAGSDDIWLASDESNYESLGGHTKYGKILQIPAFAGAVVIGFNGKDGNGNPLTFSGSIPSGGSSGFNLSRQALCGIFSGHITQWSNPILTALGVNASASGPITVVHRSDGSGTNFLLTNALAAQCLNVYGPTSETNSALTLYELPWSDRTISTSQCNASAPKSAAIPFQGSDLVNWPDYGTDQCGTSISNTGGGTFVSVSGNSGVAAKIVSQNGAIGYTTTDYAQPVVATGPKGANVQSQYDLDNSTGLYQAPTSTTVANSMNSDIPFFSTAIANPAADVTNPLNWSHEAIIPNPSVPAGYPIAGFTFMDYYQCIRNNPSDPVSGNNLGYIFAYLTYHYADPTAAAIMNANGFANISETSLPLWYNAIVTLLTEGSSAMNWAGIGACAGVSPGA